MITVFPSVVSANRALLGLPSVAHLSFARCHQLCELPSLEILDISRNKIRKLPSEPGSLLNLRVGALCRLRRSSCISGLRS